LTRLRCKQLFLSRAAAAGSYAEAAGRQKRNGFVKNAPGKTPGRFSCGGCGDGAFFYAGRFELFVGRTVFKMLKKKLDSGKRII